MATESFYCMKCRKKVAVGATTKRTLKNGRHMLVGVCPTCKGKVFKFTA